MDNISRRSKFFVGIASLVVIAMLLLDLGVVRTQLELANGSKQVVERQNSTISVNRNVSAPSTVGKVLNASSPSAPYAYAAPSAPFVRQSNPANEPRPVVSPSVTNVSESSISMENTSTIHVESGNKSLKFYVLHVPQLTSYLVSNFTEIAMNYYQTALNEERGEIWLDRGLRRLSLEEGRTDNPSEADVVFVPAYLHLHRHVVSVVKESERSGTPPGKGAAAYLLSRVFDKTKPHVLLVPTWNPEISRKVGVAAVIKTLKGNGVNTWSVGFERNENWQHVSVDRIIPVPYVVNPAFSQQELYDAISTQRIPNFVFYVGDSRGLAIPWGGCNRTMIEPLTHRTDMLVRLVSTKERVTQEEYNRNLLRAEYCLILCGDTPTSRSLASSMLHGCIPIRVGSRLRGLCEPPCHAGWGWTVANLPHLPYGDRIDWNVFPEVNESEFARDPSAVLDAMMNATSPERKVMLRAVMQETQLGWVYGWGNPVDSDDFGEAASYIWSSVKHILASHLATLR